MLRGDSRILRARQGAVFVPVLSRFPKLSAECGYHEHFRALASRKKDM